MAKTLTRKDKKELNGCLSKFFERIAELVFAGIILSGIIKEDNSFSLVGYFHYRRALTTKRAYYYITQ